MPRTWRIPRPRFSLLSLLVGAVFVGSCFGLWYRREPWALTWTSGIPESAVKEAATARKNYGPLALPLSVGSPVIAPGGGHFATCLDLISPFSDGGGYGIRRRWGRFCICLHDLETGALLRALPWTEHSFSKGSSVVFSPAGQWLTMSFSDGDRHEVEVYRAGTGDPLVLPQLSASWPQKAFFSHDDTMLVYQSDPSQVHL